MDKMRIDMTANIQQIQQAAQGWSIEVTPAGATKIDSFAACLAPETTVNVTFLPGTDPMETCLLYTSPSPRDLSTSRMPSSA